MKIAGKFIRRVVLLPSEVALAIAMIIILLMYMGNNLVTNGIAEGVIDIVAGILMAWVAVSSIVQSVICVLFCKDKKKQISRTLN